MATTSSYCTWLRVYTLPATGGTKSASADIAVVVTTDGSHTRKRLSTAAISVVVTTDGTGTIPGTGAKYGSSDITVVVTISADWAIGRVVSEDLTVADTLIQQYDTSLSFTDIFTIDDTYVALALAHVLEDLTLSDDYVAQVIANLTENMTLSLTTQFGWPKTILEDLTLDDAALYELIANIVENIDLLALATTGATLNVSILDGGTLSDRVICIFPYTVEDSISISKLAVASKGLNTTVSDLQTLTGITSSRAVFYTEALGFFTLDDSSLEIEAILEALSVADTQEVLQGLYETITEHTEITRIDSNHLGIYLSNIDTMGINDINLSQHLSNLSVDEGIKFEISKGYADEVYSGWVMNPENYAVSNYSFDFTSSAFFKDKYLFASHTGLYELGGTTDDGSAIESRIKTAALNFGTETAKQMRQAILGTDGDTFVLIVSTDDHKTAYYELIAPSDGLSNKRVKIGKGIIGTRFQFELVHIDEEDFDLQSMELFPVVFKRKLK